MSISAVAVNRINPARKIYSLQMVSETLRNKLAANLFFSDAALLDSYPTRESSPEFKISFTQVRNKVAQTPATGIHNSGAILSMNRTGPATASAITR